MAFGLALAGDAAKAAVSDTQLTAGDGARLHALVAPLKGSAKGVVLVHMLGREAADWKYLGERLGKAGLQTIAVDLRGHGRSDKAGQELLPGDYPQMTQDVAAAVAWLRGQGATQISCVGASIGANLCLEAAAADAGIVNVVALSPGLNYKGVTSPDAVDALGQRPLLLVASQEDQYSAKSAVVLEQRAQGQHHYLMLKGAGHGSVMLNRDSSLEGVILSWLLGTYQLASGELVTPRPAGESAVENVQTEGEKLDSHK